MNGSFRIDDDQPRRVPNEPAAHSEGAAALGDDWYLLAYRTPSLAEAPEFNRRVFGPVLGQSWKKIAVACTLGVALGLSAALLQFSRSASHPKVVVASLPPAEPAIPVARPRQPVLSETPRTTAIQSAEAPKLTADEVARLKTRNKRLEALIAVLRQRAHTPDKKATPEQNNILGQ